MAHCIRRPLPSIIRKSPTCAFQPRHFSNGPLRLAGAKSLPMAQGRAQPQQSLKTAMKNKTELPTDMGLLADTFIMPTGPTKPSIFTAPRNRLKMEWRRLRTRAVDMASLVAYKWITKPRLKLRKRKVAPTAAALHRQMYTAFAEGDTTTLRHICADGLFESLRTRIAARRGERVDWSIQNSGVFSFPRLVSDRGARLPIEGAGLRQAVVRIRSQQTLTRWKDGVLVPGTGEPKECQEYVVIQKRLWKGKEEGWMVWGTVQETTMEEVLEAERQLA